MNWPSDRAVLDVYEIIVYPQTGKVEAVRPRSLLIHYDLTKDVLYDPPSELCFECSLLTVYGIDARNSFNLQLYLINNSGYMGRDIRAIIIEDSTNPETLEMLFPDDYTDVWSQNHGDKDFPGTNPFMAYKKSIPDRVFEQGEFETQSRQIMVNLDPNTSTEEVRALLIIDGSALPGEPNCREPYEIKGFSQYRNLDTGVYTDQFNFSALDHQANYDDVHAWITFNNPLISSPVAKLGGSLFQADIFVDPSLPGGTYEGIIEAWDNAIQMPPSVVRSLKEKFWLTVNPEPSFDTYNSVGHSARIISSPVRVQLDSDPFLETVYTADNRVYVIDSDGIPQHLNIGAGMFVGIPTFSQQDINQGLEIIFVNDAVDGPPGTHRVWVYRWVPGNPGAFQYVWDYQLSSPPAGQAVPVDLTADPYDEILILLENGRKVLLRGGPSPPLGRLIYSVASNDTYVGAPAIYSTAPGSVNATFIKTPDGFQYKLEVFRVLLDSQPAFEKEVDIPDVSGAFNPTPAVDFMPSVAGDFWEIFVPCEDRVVRVRDDFGGNLTIGWESAIQSQDNNLGQLALGDINRDLNTDVVVPFGDKMVAFDGTDGDMIWEFSIPNEDYEFSSPSLIDFNGDFYLDVVAGIRTLSGNPPRLVVIDGSPFNNHNRDSVDDRILWERPGIGMQAMGQQPCFTRTVTGMLRIGMTYKQNDNGTPGDYTYQAVQTNYRFTYDNPYQRQPWLMGFYDWKAHNNFENPPPLFDEGM